ncbi:MAG: glycosyltransferase family 4 protein [Bacteroidota bacterium]|nr:glycosyltransferase family 4 protein [Bacteroidota bacterium]MDP4232258.1 glycosyltransferase family 4 protein [Bacteroidota bacterium]MDP4242660.1 glycosyltransferase family 4 protein [Bacteroidota bacterium]MDP4286778.1 glycosyltransferase family 4 protein [Bacteroidota bacterium]
MRPVLHVITSDARGGLELYVSSLIRAQAASGRDVAAYALPGSLIHHELQASGIRIFDAMRQSHFSPADISMIRRLARKEGALVHSHTRFDVWAASFALYGTRIPHVHSTYMVPARKRDPHHFAIYSRVDAIISSSLSANRQLARYLPVPSDRLQVVRYGRHLDRFVRSAASRDAMRVKLGIADHEVAFGMIGRIEPAKGVREFAESLSCLNPKVRDRVKYFIIGARNETNCEDYNASLVEFQQRPGIRERLTILPWTTDPVPYLNALDCLVLASYNEMYSLSVLDAMAMSLPVIGTDSEGTPEQIGANERGLLVHPRSPESIANAVERYVLDPSLMVIHGEAGFKWVHQEHSMDRSLDALDRVYSLAIARRTRIKPVRLTPDGLPIIEPKKVALN